MKRLIRVLEKGLLWLSVFVVVLAISGVVYQTAATESDQRNYPAPGLLVNVNGHKMHIYCMGEGSPTILLDHAGGGSSVDWALIQPKLAAHTRVCAYDRAGFGWSDYSPAPRTLSQQVNELHELLKGAHEPGPYIIVGHSYGARVDRVFAATYPKDVAGMVLLDPGILYDDPRYPAETQSQQKSENTMIRAAGWLSPFGLVRLLQPAMSNPTFDLPEQARLTNASFSATSSYWQSLNDQTKVLSAGLNEERQVTTLGDLPLLVLISTEPQDATHKVWIQANEEMSALSTQGSYRLVEGAMHFSLVYRQKDAQVCIAGILQVLETARKERFPAPINE